MSWLKPHGAAIRAGSRLFNVTRCNTVCPPPVSTPTEELRTIRLKLCDLTARTLKQGLELLGIETVERM
jgi:hypothetical protein